MTILIVCSVATVMLLSIMQSTNAFRGNVRTMLSLRVGSARSMLRMSTEAGDKHFDYLVIGGGSGGVASARRAASYGAKVAVVEGARLGGTCVNVGCVPKKVMWNAAAVSEILHQDAKQFGFDVQGYSFDWARLKTARDAYVTRLNGIYARMLQNSGVTSINGLAAFSGANSVDVNGETYTAKHILIAVGGIPSVPNLPGAEHCITSDGFFALEQQPAAVAVIGGGYIGVELAGVFQALGTSTDLFTRGDKPLRGFDSLVVDTLLSEMKKQGMKYRPNQNPAEVIKGSDGRLTIRTTTGDEFGPFDQVLLATGRRPNTKPLNLAAAGVQCNERGYITADEFQRTNTDGVYALGDVCGKIELTPMAIAAGRRLADRLFNGMADAKADYDAVPTVVFSHPTIGTCGLTEEEAVQQFGADNIKCYKSTFTNLWYGTWDMEADDKPKTAMKLVTVLPEERVVGLHMIGMGCDEALQGFGVAMKMGATKADFDSCVAIHPTAAEELVTMAPWGMAPSSNKK